MVIRAVLLAGLLVLSSCASMSGLGGFGGGSRSPSSGNPVMVSGLISGPIGAGLGAGEKQRALAAEFQALEYAQSGQAVTWTGGSGRSGSVIPAQPYRVGSQDCRQYTQTVVRDGQTKIARGTACRNSDGSWTPLT